MPWSLTESLFGALASHAARPCLTSPSVNWTYADLDQEAAHYASGLSALGVHKGARVLVQVEKSPFALALYLAVERIGAIYVPVNPDNTPAELGYFLSDAAPAAVICAPERASALRALCDAARPPALATLSRNGAGSLKAAATGRSGVASCGAQDLAAILYTSGTTGRPKGAMLSQGNLLSNAQALIDAWRFTSDDVLIHALPIFHTHGLFIACHCTLLSGASMIFMPRFDADEIITRIPDASVLMGVPTFYTRLLAHPGLTQKRARHMRLFISGSAPLSPETFREFEERTGMRILERYGMTETGMLTSNPYDGERIAGTVGYPLAGVELRIVNPDTRIVQPDGEVGEVEVRGPNVFSGYWRAPEKTKESFRENGFFVTGDLGFLDAKGYLHLVGRAKDIIISGGLNVYPTEVEDALQTLAAVAEAAVFGIPHPDLGEAVVAAVTLKPGHMTSESAIRSDLASILARYKIPKRVLLMESLPRNTMGKVQRTVLRTMYKNLFTATV